MRLLHFADLHLDTPFAWARPGAARARRRALRQSLVRIRELAVELKVDAVCCGGDLYEQDRFTPDTAEFIRAQFAALAPVPVFLAPGNHDWMGPHSLYRLVSWSGNVHLFTEPRLEAVPVADGFTLWGAAHCAPANTPGFLDGFAIDRGGINIALFHGSEQGELRFKTAARCHTRRSGPRRSRRPALITRWSATSIPPATRHTTPTPATRNRWPSDETGERGAVLVTVDGAGVVRRERHRVAVSLVSEATVDLTG